MRPPVSTRQRFLREKAGRGRDTDLVDKVHFGPHVYSHAHDSSDSSVHTCKGIGTVVTEEAGENLVLPFN